MNTSRSLLLIVLFCSGCGTQEHAPPQVDSTVPILPEPQSVPDARPELQTQYNFAVGDGAVTQALTGRVNVTGAWGSIVQWSTGSTTGWLLPNTQIVSGATWPDPTEHARLAQGFLQRIGVRPGEIGHVKRMTIRDGVEARDSDHTISKVSVTALGRRIDGVLVPDSTAWAQVTAEGVPVAFSIFWPDVPTAVVADANVLRRTLEVGWRPNREFFNETDPPVVVITHSDFTAQRLRFRAAIRVFTRARNTKYWVDFDGEGRELPPLDPPHGPVPPIR